MQKHAFSYNFVEIKILLKMKPTDILKATWVELNNARYAVTKNASFISNEEEKHIVNEIREKGYYVVENVYPIDWCEKAIAEINVIIDRYNDQIWQDDAKSDHRLFGADKVSDLINNFYNDEFARRILQTYEGIEVKDGFTLGARLDHKPGNIGSGGGWHRDHAKTKQSKSILYLTDVSIEHGPFQYIEESHKSLKVYADSNKYNLDPFQNRFEDEQVEKLIQAEPARLKTLTGNAGTMILADTRGIHRGMPIQKDVRYALTNYFWFHTVVPSHMARKLLTGSRKTM